MLAVLEDECAYICPVNESSDVSRCKMLMAILEEDDSLKMKNNYRPMLGLYLATSNHSGEKALKLANNIKKRVSIFIRPKSNP